MFPIENDEFAPLLITAAQATQAETRRYQRNLAQLCADFEEEFDENAPLTEQAQTASDYIAAVHQAGHRHDMKANRIIGKVVVPMLEQSGAPAEIIQAARQSAGLPPMVEPGDEVSGESGIPGIDPEFVAEPERPKRDFDGQEE